MSKEAAAAAEHITPEFEKAAVEVARHYDIADVDAWEELPDGYRRLLQVVEYKSLVSPLVRRDRCELSWPQLAIKYRLTVKEVRTICRKAYYKARIVKKSARPGQAK